MKITRTCQQCQCSFEAASKEVNRGNAKFCSRTCARKHQSQQRPAQKHNCTCALCGMRFYRPLSNQKKSKVTGLQFCSRLCKDSAQSLKESVLIRSDSANGRYAYRDFAFSVYSHKCNRCGYDKYIQVLEVHHKDRNRLNNQIDNLEILCRNCHAEEHLVSDS